jgi:hypothetical protein
MRQAVTGRVRPVQERQAPRPGSPRGEQPRTPAAGLKTDQSGSSSSPLPKRSTRIAPSRCPKRSTALMASALRLCWQGSPLFTAAKVADAIIERLPSLGCPTRPRALASRKASILHERERDGTKHLVHKRHERTFAPRNRRALFTFGCRKDSMPPSGVDGGLLETHRVTHVRELGRACPSERTAL